MGQTTEPPPAMPEPAYSFRASLRSPEMSYRLAGEGLEWSGGSGMGQLPYAEIRQIRRYQSPGMWFVQSGATIPGFTRCVVRPRHGPTQVLSSNHFIGLGAFEDRSATFEPFVAALVDRAAAADPCCVFLTGMPAPLWLLWLIVFLLTALTAAFAGAVAIAAVILDPAGQIVGIAAALMVLVTAAVALRSLWRMLTRSRSRRFFRGRQRMVEPPPPRAS